MKSARKLPAAIVLASERELKTSIKQLAGACPVMREIYARVGVPPLRDFPADFSGIVKIVTGQQLSAASAAAIWSRVEPALAPFDAAAVLSRRDEDFAALGLSRAKIKTIKAFASAIHAEGFDIATLNALPDAAIVERLTSIHGIGPWTANIYILFALRRSDAFAAGDLALQLAVQRRLRLKSRPCAAGLEEIAERWRPWRAVAARLLWADYAAERLRVKSQS